MISSSWWASLKHGGLLIAPSRIAEHFPGTPVPLPSYLAERLRRDVTRLETGSAEVERALLDTVMEKICGLDEAPGARWTRGSDVAGQWSHRALTGEIVKPRRLWEGPNGALLPVFVDGEGRLGVGRGRRAVSRVIEWLRRAGRPIALLTNARQWRLIYAGLDHEAWAEWDVDLWFEEGRPGLQVDAFRMLLSPEALTPAKPGEPSRLVAAILDSRRGQAELSAVLGERVRLAVEVLIQSHGVALNALGSGVTPRDIYLAATRVVMRMIVVLFAEARELLPREDPVYYRSYGLEGLREALERAGTGSGAARLRHRFGAWPRLLALFRLVFEGSHHPSLPVPRYGGGLFAPGSAASPDPVLRALTVFEDPAHAPSDAAVLGILLLLCRSQVRVRQGKGSIAVEAPVDFSDLSCEYIGVLYEGLLDYELRRAGADDPYVFLAVGDEPALPLSRLETMDDSAMAPLVEKLKRKARLAVGTEEVSEEGDEASEDTDADRDEEEETAEDDSAAGVAVSTEPPQSLPAAEQDDAQQAMRKRAEAWARRAVSAGKLVPRPKSKNPETLREYERAVESTARSLVERVILPDEWFLVRWGGTRKGSGTFYTRPQLAVPTAQRTLRPLAYDPPVGAGGNRDENAPAAAWIPKSPEQILALTVCDPAMGSGSFLVASLRFLTSALFASLFHHGWLRREGDRLLVTASDGGRPAWFLEVVRDMPVEVEDAEQYLQARLKRHVVERCLYGVDLDSLAVELGRLALWVETIDRSLPFEFLDHKLKVGNALVGCWFDRFRDYPALAWEREGADSNHDRFVHHFREERVQRGKQKGAVRRSGDVWTHELERFETEKVKPALADWISGQRSLFDAVEGRTPEALHDEAVNLFEQMHALPIHETDARAVFYRDKILGSQALARLAEAFDTWCALWFWPADQLDLAPLPATFETLAEPTRAVVRTLKGEHRFFHWELEFPEVFAASGGGFHAIVGNPPWEIQKPNSREFFSNLDPLYRTYGKQEALGKQREYFQRSARDERAWLQYCARFKALANWNRSVASPFGDGADDGERLNLGKGSAALHAAWRAKRAGRKGYADPAHPFRYQGSADINTYKMFLEQARALLRDGGLLGLITPSGVYTDKGSTDLRVLFLTRCRWRWLFGFENREGIFNIHRSFKFGPVIIQKGGTTEAFRTTFMRRRLRDWEEAERHAILYSRLQVERFSPRTRAILEIRDRRDLEVLEKIYANSILLGDKGPDGWGIRYATEFHMTNDSDLFPPRPKWEEKGYRRDEYGRWIKFRRQSPDARHAADPGWIRLADGSGFVHEDDIEDIALPLYEGRMIGQFDFSQKGWVSGKGRGAVWREIPWEAKVVEPQYLMGIRDLLDSGKGYPHPKIAYMRISSATNSRTTIATYLNAFPAGDSVFFFRSTSHSAMDCLAIVGFFNTLVFDYQARNRLGGLNMSEFVMIETVLPRRTALAATSGGVLRAVGSLSLCARSFAGDWLRLAPFSAQDQTTWKNLWAVTPHERLRLRCFLEAVVAELYGLEWEDLAWILRECDYPAESLRDKAFRRTFDPKGFWRVDKEKDPELRHTVLSLVASRNLQEMIAAQGGDRERGIEAFCRQNDGDGWMLPEALRLSDLGLGHDERAKEPQPVRERLGERFLPWQLEQSAAESWTECERHARNLLGPDGFARLQAELRGEAFVGEREPLTKVAEPSAEYSGGPGAQRRLFPGEPTLFGNSQEDPPRRGKRRRP